jgi:hypothetical protein
MLDPVLYSIRVFWTPRIGTRLALEEYYFGLVLLNLLLV